MASAIRAVSIEVGEDPRSAALIAYGGAGSAVRFAAGARAWHPDDRIPNHAGNFSAWGLLEQDVVRSAALTIVSPLDDEGIARAQETHRAAFEQLDSRAETDLRAR